MFVKGLNLTFGCFVILLVIGVSGSLDETEPDDYEMTSRMPMHKTHGIFDLVSPGSIAKFMLRIVYKPFSVLFKNLRPIMKTLFHIAKKLGTAIIGPLLTPAVAKIAARTLGSSQVLDLVYLLTGNELFPLLSTLFPQV